MEYKYDRLLHGGDYNPEQWLDQPDILETDIEYLKKSNCNVVSVGIFSWSVLEPEEGCFEFQWLTDLIDKLYRNNIYVVLATPSGARPKWLSDKYPEVLRVDENRQRNLFGGRHNHCYTSPVYRKKVGIINTELAKRYANHPGVILWHVSNEYSGECHCEYCQDAFRSWLKDKYKTVETLNKAWYTTFWSHIYNSFDQIESPSPRGENGLHGLKLDWRRFVTRQTLDFAREEIRVLRQFNETLSVTTNLMYFYEGLNYFKFKEVFDIISWDTYPTWHKEPESITAKDNGMYHDLIRSIKNQPFLQMESTPSYTNWQGVSKLKKPGMHELSCLQAIAHGSDSVMYFQWRQSAGASEKFHGAVVDHYGGADTRTFHDVTNLGNGLLQLQEVCHSKVNASVAVIYDWENHWAIKDSAGPRNNGMFYKETVAKSYNAFRKLGLNVDVIDMEVEFKNYKIVAAPLIYMLRNGLEEKIRQYVREGGIFIGTYWSGIVDENDRCYLGGTPYGLMDVFGLRSQEIDGLYDWETNSAIPLVNNPLGIEKIYSCNHLCELVKTDGAVPLMVYGEDFYKGLPVLTRNHYEKGEAYYICADMEEAFYQDLYKKLITQKGIETIINRDIPEGVEVTSRVSEKYNYIFIQNFNRMPVKMNLTGWEDKIIFGKYNGTIKEFGTVIFKTAL